MAGWEFGRHFFFLEELPLLRPQGPPIFRGKLFAISFRDRYTFEDLENAWGLIKSEEHHLIWNISHLVCVCFGTFSGCFGVFITAIYITKNLNHFFVEFCTWHACQYQVWSQLPTGDMIKLRFHLVMISTTMLVFVGVSVYLYIPWICFFDAWNKFQTKFSHMVV